ncbi:class I SAM-dependent methyltransferase [Rhodanobacter sp. C03]|uniref:class I SAM-dependent methyltransferase n=1 Tax=Rhodanobacter sp. C03 TaxID=1945858 RepID=UPI001439BA8A|nr:class I SAM-dependent methyltransferase [Rhodanobacter sp. C03]
MALLKYHATFAQLDILDLGVGAGRTTIYLAPLARRYEAIDYSPEMVATMQATMPAVSVHLGDMRDLSCFPDGSFDFVLGACNVIDAVNHEDRGRTLSEVARVLRRDGTFMFSSHNRDLFNALSAPRLELSRNPVTLLLNLLRWVRQVANHMRMTPLREVRPDYALLDDDGHDHALLHYYVRQDYERKQLQQFGFETIEVFDEAGRSLDPNERAPESPHLMYVERKH